MTPSTDPPRLWTPPLPPPIDNPATEALIEDPLVAAKLAALASPCFFHRRIDDAVNIQDILADESVSHSRLLQTVTSVREAARQLQRRPMRRAVRNVMIITKARDNDLVVLTRELAEWLLATPRYGTPLGVTVYVDHKLRGSKRFDAAGLLAKDARFAPLLKYWTPDMCWSSPERFDLVLTLGGDGTVLFTSWLFQRIVPPVLSFSLGSLGFLTPFDFADYRRHLDRVMGGVSGMASVAMSRRTSGFISPALHTTAPPSLQTLSPASASGSTSLKRSEVTMAALSLVDGLHSHPHSSSTSLSNLIVPPSPDLAADAGMRVNLRMRFTCAVWRANTPSAISNGQPTHIEAASFEVLNELVIDRGPSPYVSNLELYASDDNDHAAAIRTQPPSPYSATSPSTPSSASPAPRPPGHCSLLTVIQADGVIFSTPTGSTAYSLSAGGSLVHPDIPAILLTPICPHTLSFRPMLLDDAMALRVAVPKGSRATAWCSFDGKGRVELRQGDYVSISASRYPFPVVEGGGRAGGRERWIDTVSRTLRWNTREARQKAWSSAGAGRPGGRAGVYPGAVGLGMGPGEPDGGDGEEDEDADGNAEQGFDIDFDEPEPDEEEARSAKDSGYGGEGCVVPSAGGAAAMGVGLGAGSGTATPVRRRSGGAVG